MLGLGPNRCRIEKVASISPRALSEPPTAPVDVICAALEGHVHHGAAVIPELRRKAVVLDFEFLNHFNRGFVINVAGRSLSLFGCADQGAINADLSRGVSLAIGYKVCSRRIVVRGAGACSFGNTTGKKREPEEIA